MIQANSDILVDRTLSGYPFEASCAQSLGVGATLPSGAIESLMVDISPDAIPPVRLAEIRLIGDRSCEAVMRDSRGEDVAIWTCHLDSPGLSGACSSFVFGPLGDVRGTIRFAVTHTGALIAAAQRAGGAFATDLDDFVLLPCCLRVRPFPSAMAVSVNGITLLTDVSVTAGDGLETSGEGTVSLSIPGESVPVVASNGPCRLIVPDWAEVEGESASTTADDPVWLGARSLSVRSGITSNLRVSTRPGGVRLSGPEDKA